MRSSRLHYIALRDLTQIRGVGPDAEWAGDTFQPAAALADRVLHRLHLDERVKQDKIKRIWPNLVGEFVAKNSYPESIRKGILFIKVSNAPLKHQLELMKMDLLKRLQAQVGKEIIRDLRLLA